jgi:hypothetical protein
MLNKMVTTGELQKLYKQGSTKMYGRDQVDGEAIIDDVLASPEDKPAK